MPSGAPSPVRLPVESVSLSIAALVGCFPPMCQPLLVSPVFSPLSHKTHSASLPPSAVAIADWSSAAPRSVALPSHSDNPPQPLFLSYTKKPASSHFHSATPAGLYSAESARPAAEAQNTSHSPAGAHCTCSPRSVPTPRLPPSDS